MFALLVKFITTLKVPVLLLTATLPEDRKQQIVDALGESETPAFIESYGKHEKKIRYQQVKTNQSVKHAFKKVDKAVYRKEKVLFIVNTVEFARELYFEIKERYPNIKNTLCLHSRFKYQDRREKEKQLMSKELLSIL